MFRALYTLLITLVSPFFLYSLLKKHADKPHIGKRWKEYFGFCAPLTHTQAGEIIWLHTVSVGEVLGASDFVRTLKTRYPNKTVVLTTTTTTGAQQAEKLGDLVEHRFMPLDFPWAIKRFIRTINPSQLLIMETELWPNTLAVTHQQGIPISIINARLSDRSAQRYQKLASLGRFLARHIHHIYCLHQDDAQRFTQLGFSHHQVSVTGSLKFDISISPEDKAVGLSLRNTIGQQRQVWIAASTHQGEDEIVLNAHQHLLEKYPDALLVLVPRHPERFQSVFELVKQMKLRAVRRTQTTEIGHDIQVYLADTMGEMKQLLAACDICFMGGSLIGDKVGGHNLLEPAALGLPTITGPSYFNFTDITNQLLAAHATVVCDSADSISQQLITLFSEPAKIAEQGAQAQQVVNRNRGSINNTLAGLFPHEES